ncbi:MAG: glycosyltransferase family 4 protein [Holosporales bacterium]|jgi:glycosyltransferase involved in cell wall biosynthesis|nr:glycosyltransferase family 4 protein [Holosporales bacterium]
MCRCNESSHTFFEKKKVLFLVTEEWALLTHRLAMVRAFQGQGAIVSVATSLSKEPMPIEGVRLLSFPWGRRSLNLLREGRRVWRLIRLLRQEKPDYLLNIALKPALYGTVAALFCQKIICINFITGLGYLFTEKTLKAACLRKILWTLLRLFLRSTKIIVQNSDDFRLFRSFPNVSMIRGSGVDCERFIPTPEPEGPCTIVLPARILWHKGVKEFVEAARILKKTFPEVRFCLVGRMDPQNPAAVPAAILSTWTDSGVVEWLGIQEDMASIYAASHIVCLPSYREGMPKALLEAAASGRPIVTTDTVGCREVVRHEDNGLLVPPRTVTPLVEALRTLIQDPAERLRMGQRSRQRAEQEFCQEKICAEVLRTVEAFHG